MGLFAEAKRIASDASTASGTSRPRASSVYSRVFEEENENAASNEETRWQLVDNAIFQFRWLLRRTAILPVMIMILVFFTWIRRPIQYRYGVEQQPPSFLRMLMPVNTVNENVCKVLLSATVLDYPTPLLINWGVSFEEANVKFGGSHLAKITGTLNYLKSLDPRHDDDIVVMVDALDVWFQLPPSVLMQRYHEILSKENTRMNEQLGEGRIAAGIEAKVVFTAEKNCWPRRAYHNCTLLPESPFPDDLYGPLTDEKIAITFDGAYSISTKRRPRWLNAGFAMGPVAAFKPMLERAAELVEMGVGDGASDQYIFARIFSEQEVNRLAIAKRYLPIQTAELLEDVVLPKLQPNRNYQFGISLDYENKLIQSITHAAPDLEWVRHDDTEGILKASRDRNLTESRIRRLANDIKQSPLPFSYHNGAPTELLPDPRIVGSLPVDLRWDQVPLSTSLFTGIVPVGVHYNKGSKNFLKKHWDRTWFQPYGRSLLDVHVLAPANDKPIAVTTTATGRTTAGGLLKQKSKREWWSPVSQRGVIDTDRENTHLYLEDVCREHWEAVFQDGLGEWSDPRWTRGIDERWLPRDDSAEILAATQGSKKRGRSWGS